MTNEEALAEAKRRYGEKAGVRFDTMFARPYLVHINRGDRHASGHGHNWEEAFKDAEGSE